MNIRFTKEPDIPVIMIRHRGPYEGLQPKFDLLYQWAEQNGVETKRFIGIYWDNPEYTAPELLRSAACVEVSAKYILPSAAEHGIGMWTVTGGEYAITQFTGPYERLEPVWANFIAEVENNYHRTISENPAFEVYVNDPADTPADQLVTELYLPLA